MYKVFESAMSGTFDLTKMLERINHHHVLGNLSNDERDRLEILARSKANPFGGVDVMEKLREMDERIRTLEEAAKGNASEGGTAETVAEYVTGKWYHTGDQVSYNGKVYTCIAPEGRVCTWSPSEYPAYWEERND